MGRREAGALCFQKGGERLRGAAEQVHGGTALRGHGAAAQAGGPQGHIGAGGCRCPANCLAAPRGRRVVAAGWHEGRPAARWPCQRLPAAAGERALPGAKCCWPVLRCRCNMRAGTAMPPGLGRRSACSGSKAVLHQCQLGEAKSTACACTVCAQVCMNALPARLKGYCQAS